MSTLLNDIKYAFRQLFRSPGFAGATMLVLTLGIGINSAIFSVVNTVLLRPLPFEEPERLALIWQTNKTNGDMRCQVSYPNIEDWRLGSQVFEGIAAFCPRSKTFYGREYPVKVDGVCASANLFSMLRIRPLMGRTFTAEEERRGIKDHVILSHAFWQHYCQADPEIVGSFLRFNEQSYTVIGVLPDRVFSNKEMDRAQIWTLITEETNLFHQRGYHALSALARLKDGVTFSAANARIEALADRLAGEYESNRDFGARVVSLQSDIVHSVKSTLWILLGAVGFVLLIACSNAANLLLIRARTRQREFVIRVALGASRWQLIRQALLESGLYCLFSGVAGLSLTWIGMDIMKAIVPVDLPRIQEISMDPQVVLFTCLITLVSGLLFGLLPAWRSSCADSCGSLKENTRSTEGVHGSRLRDLLVVGEIALSLILLIGATLLMRSFWNLTHVETGFQSDQVLTWHVDLSGAQLSNKEDRQAFYQQCMERLQALPKVQAVGATTTLPFTGGMGVGIRRLSGPEHLRTESLLARYNSVTTGYFQAMGIPLLRGRLFSDRDVTASTGSLIINETMARQYFPGEDPIGERIDTGGRISETDPENYEVIGIVGDTTQGGYDHQVGAEMFLPFTQQVWDRMTFTAQIEGDPLSLVEQIRTCVRQVNTNVLVDHFKTMNQHQSESVAQRRFIMTLILIFGGLALSLTIVGIYGVIAYATAQRTLEIGIRMAVGARSQEVAFMILTNGLKLGLAGTALGIVGAIGLSRILKSMLFECSPTDPVTYSTVALLLLAVSLLACWIPARRAAKTDPMEALRYE